MRGAEQGAAGTWALPPGGLVSLHEFPELDDEDSGIFATLQGTAQPAAPPRPPEFFVPRAGTVISSPGAQGDAIDDDVLAFSPRVVSPTASPHMRPQMEPKRSVPAVSVVATPPAQERPLDVHGPRALAHEAHGHSNLPEDDPSGESDVGEASAAAEPAAVVGAGMGDEAEYVAELRRVGGEAAAPAHAGETLHDVYQAMCRMLAQGEAMLPGMGTTNARGDVVAAMRVLEGALPLARRLGLRRIESRVCSNLANLCITRGDVARARTFNAQHLRAVAPLRRVTRGSAFTPAWGRGEGQGMAAEDAAALVARHGAHAVEAEREYGKALGNRGNIALLAREYSTAVRVFRERLEVAVGCADRDAAAMAYGNLGVAYQACRQYHQAVSMYARRRVHAREQGDVRTEVKMNGHIAACLCAMGQHKRALQLYASNIELMARMARGAGVDDARARVTAHVGVGDCYAHLAMPSRALGFYSRALALLDDADASGGGDTLRVLRRVYKRTARCHEALGDAAQAAHFGGLASAKPVDA